MLSISMRVPIRITRTHFTITWVNDAIPGESTVKISMLVQENMNELVSEYIVLLSVELSIL